MRTTTFFGGNGLAERVGFEPTNTGEDVTGIPVQRLRPLGHLSGAANDKAWAPEAHPAGAPLGPRRGPSGLRGLGHLVGRRLVETGLLALTRRRGRLIERRQTQRARGIGRIHSRG